MNTKTKTFTMLLLEEVLVAGVISITIPSTFADSEYRGYEDEYAKDPYYYKEYNI